MTVQVLLHFNCITYEKYTGIYTNKGNKRLSIAILPDIINGRKTKYAKETQ